MRVAEAMGPDGSHGQQGALAELQRRRARAARQVERAFQQTRARRLGAAQDSGDVVKRDRDDLPTAAQRPELGQGQDAEQ